MQVLGRDPFFYASQAWEMLDHPLANGADAKAVDHVQEGNAGQDQEHAHDLFHKAKVAPEPLHEAHEGANRNRRQNERDAQSN